MTAVVIDGARRDLAGLPLLGAGGEAEVYDLGDGRALKLYKGPDHPDVVGEPARVAAARARLADLEAKLGEFPRGLPSAVVAPTGLARSTARGRAALGYVMPKVTGTPMFALGEPRHRRATATDLPTLVAAFADLHATLRALHAAGVVVGDLNDGNLLVDGGRCHLLDADSLQFGRWPCALYTERFVDPRLCDRAAAAPTPRAPHDPASDWFAYAVLLFRALAWVGPFGGVHQPADPAARVAPAARSLRGPSVFGPDVIYPRSAVPLAGLADAVAAYFRQVFDGGRRGEFPRGLLDELRLSRCPTCAIDHGRDRCPACRHVAPALALTGQLTARALDPWSLPATGWSVGASPVPGAPPVWLSADTLWRTGTFGPEAIGRLVAGASHAWVGPRLGAGYWRAGGYAVGFTFRPDRRGVDDRARLPPLRGRIVDHGCALGDDHAWLWWREADLGRERYRVVALRAGAVIATAEAEVADAGWHHGLAGACAVGPYLFVPTDDGLVRVEAVAGTAAVTRRFVETAPLCAAVDTLVPIRDGLALIKAGAPLALATGPARAVALTFTARAAGQETP